MGTPQLPTTTDAAAANETCTTGEYGENNKKKTNGDERAKEKERVSYPSP